MPAHRLRITSGASGRAIHLDHPAIDHQEDADGEDLRTQPHEDALEPQPQQGADAPVRELGLQVGGHAGYVDARVRDDDAGALADHVLRYIEHRHDDVPGVGDDEHRAEGLEDPLEEDPGVEVVEIVLFYDELDQLIRVRTASARMRCCVPQSVPHGTLVYWLQVNCGSRFPL